MQILGDYERSFRFIVSELPDPPELPGCGDILDVVKGIHREQLRLQELAGANCASDGRFRGGRSRTADVLWECSSVYGRSPQVLESK